MPKDQFKQAPSRQRPVSCHFCRTRKLRCSRTAPCSNCVLRRVTCDLEHAVVQPRSVPSVPSNSENSEIIERLHRLETLLIAQQGDKQQTSQPSDAAEPQPKSVDSSNFPRQIQKADLASHVPWLAGVDTDHIPSAKRLRSQIVFGTCPVTQVTEAQCYIPLTNSELSRCIWLPIHSEARTLLEKFIRVAHHLPYVTHIPSLPSILEQVYADLDQQHQMQLGQVILLLSIFAVATHSWVTSDCAYGLFSTPTEANDQAALWTKAAEEVLDIACRSPKVSIEGIQGAIIIAFVAAHLDGLHRYRMLFVTSIALARDFELHRIDHPSNSGMANTAQAEIGRRIWWYLCASDWAMAARVGGVAEGIYSCHPRQMITKKPLNINDEDIFDGMSRDERPLSQPTTMSYTMQKIRLAEISRSIVDRSPLAMAHTSGLSHDAVMDIDTELQTLINDVPAFWSMSESLLMATYGLTRTQAEKIVFQGKTTYFLIYSQRCKIHVPYFARSFEDPAYYSSREICIKYARLLIHSELWQDNSDMDTVAQFKFTELLIGVFLACVVLLMDLCANSSSPQYEQQREEVQKGFKIIEGAKNGSETTAKVVDSLVHILRKYNVAPLNPDPNQQSQAISRTEMVLDIPEAPGGSERGEMAFPTTSQGQFEVSGGHGLDMAAEVSLHDSGDDISSYWSDFTQSFEQGIDVNSFDWDNIFLELDSSFI